MIKLITKIWKNKNGKFGLIIISVILFFSIFAPILTSFNPTMQNLNIVLQKPSFSHVLGTDYYGRDLFTRILYGSRVSLSISIIASAISVLFGTLIGVISGLSGKYTDNILMRIVDIMLGFPKFFILILVISMGSFSIFNTIIVLSLFSWMDTARLTRTETLLLNNTTFIKAAKAMGMNKLQIIFHHIIPNISGIVISSYSLLTGSMIILESGISFLGLGVQPPNASWGSILNEARLDPLGGWWVMLFAGIAIVTTVIGFNLLGDGLKEILQPEHYQDD